MKVERALLSVSDKRGLVPFAQALADAGVELLSSGGTARVLREAGVPVTEVAEVTGSPEILGGRVKTLHPRIHGGILSRRTPEDEADLERIGARPIDLVVVNLYPFEQTVARGAEPSEILEQIDIGGPTLVRAAAKNHPHVAIVVDPEDYAAVAEAVSREQGIDPAMRRRLARKAFEHTAAYDAAIARWMQSEEGGEAAETPEVLAVAMRRETTLRYGENPHQTAALYLERDPAPGTIGYAVRQGLLGGKPLSYNNLVDLEGAWAAVLEHEGPAAVVVKHTNPCGLATGETLAEAYERARQADPVSAFGGIVALRTPCDLATAERLVETFLECVVAPAFEPEALELLRARKKNLRLLAAGEPPSEGSAAGRVRSISGGLLLQRADRVAPGEVAEARVVTRRAPTAEERAALDFAWRVCAHVKSNAIVLARPGVTVGIGAGQMSRVEAVRIAVAKAGEQAAGAVMASDAFFPFADGVQAAAEAGVTAVVQPGGSKRDEEVIAAADEAGIAMVFTGRRHFLH